MAEQIGGDLSGAGIQGCRFPEDRRRTNQGEALVCQSFKGAFLKQIFFTHAGVKKIEVTLSWHKSPHPDWSVSAPPGTGSPEFRPLTNHHLSALPQYPPLSTSPQYFTPLTEKAEQNRTE